MYGNRSSDGSVVIPLPRSGPRAWARAGAPPAPEHAAALSLLDTSVRVCEQAYSSTQRAVEIAREAGVPWRLIGAAQGVTTDAAIKRYRAWAGSALATSSSDRGTS